MSQITDRTLLENVPANNDLLVIRDVSDTTDKPTGTDKKITLQKLMEAAPGNVEHFLEASREPDADDDSTSLFEVGSLWYVETGASAGGLFFCIDASEGAAVWVNLTSFDVSTAASLTVATDGLQLLGDEETPGAGKVYGTDGAGVKGWRDPLVSDAQQSIESATDGLRLIGDEASPGNDKVYGTGPAGARGWFDAGWRPSQTARDNLTMVAGFSLAPGATALGTEAIAIQAARQSDSQIASGDYSIALGTNNTAPGEEAISIGRGATAPFVKAVAIGSGVFAVADRAISIGNGGNASGADSIKVGSDGSASGDSAIAIGHTAASNGDGGCALGNGSSVSGTNAVALGASANAPTNYAISIGDSDANAVESIAVGRSAQSNGQQALSLGVSAQASADHSIAIGQAAASNGIESISIGKDSFSAGSVGAVAISGAEAYGERAFAVGIGSVASEDWSFAFNGASTVFAGHWAPSCLQAAPPTSQGADINSGDHAKFTTGEQVVMSDAVDLTATGDVEIALPSGVHFFPDECGIIILEADTGIAQAEISFGAGTSASEELIADVVTSGLDAPHKRQRFKSLLSDHGQQTLSAHVKTAGSGTNYTARFYWRGFAVCDEA